MAVAAATPVPVPLILNSLGATFWMIVVAVWGVDPLLELKIASPSAAPPGRTKFTWVGDTKLNAAGSCAPVESVTDNVRPPSVVGSGSAPACIVPEARFEPYSVAREL